MAAQNNALRTNYIEAKIHNIQEKSMYSLCGDIEETDNSIII